MANQYTITVAEAIEHWEHLETARWDGDSVAIDKGFIRISDSRFFTLFVTKERQGVKVMAFAPDPIIVTFRDYEAKINYLQKQQAEVAVFLESKGFKP